MAAVIARMESGHREMREVVPVHFVLTPSQSCICISKSKSSISAAVSRATVTTTRGGEERLFTLSEAGELASLRQQTEGPTRDRHTRPQITSAPLKTSEPFNFVGKIKLLMLSEQVNSDYLQ